MHFLPPYMRIPFQHLRIFITVTRAFVRKKGRNNVTVDDLVHVITPKGRGAFVFTLFI
ncbi:hypothetical protein LguiA_032862 [Lonicera macranthoides]